jgi:hypothetical protein
MGLVVRAALGSDGAALFIGRGLRIGRRGGGEQDNHCRRPKRRHTPQRVDHLNKSLLLTLEPLQPKLRLQRFAGKHLAGGIIFSFEFHRKRIVAILELRKAFSKNLL